MARTFSITRGDKNVPGNSEYVETPELIGSVREPLFEWVHRFGGGFQW